MLVDLLALKSGSVDWSMNSTHAAGTENTLDKVTRSSICPPTLGGFPFAVEYPCQARAPKDMQ
jgi:hypothetical protein